MSCSRVPSVNTCRKKSSFYFYFLERGQRGGRLQGDRSLLCDCPEHQRFDARSSAKCRDKSLLAVSARGIRSSENPPIARKTLNYRTRTARGQTTPELD